MKTKKAAAAELTSFPFDSNWVEGTVGPYTFVAQLFDNPSQYGINKGRVSRLSIFSAPHICIINYDRGWDRKPHKGAKCPLVRDVVALLEATPRRFDLIDGNGN